MSKPKRDKQLCVRLNQIELEKLSRLADQNGVSLSEAVRFLVQKLP